MQLQTVPVPQGQTKALSYHMHMCLHYLLLLHYIPPTAERALTAHARQCTHCALATPSAQKTGAPRRAELGSDLYSIGLLAPS